MVIVAAVGVVTWAYARYDRDYAEGWWEAECELWRGNATVRDVGHFSLGDFCNIDRDTGLPISVVDVNSDGALMRTQGHNDHIEQYVRWNGPPKNSVKPWERELFNLKDFFDERTKIEAPKPLVDGGQALVAPDGKHCVRPVAGRSGDGTPNCGLKLLLSSGSDVVDTPYVRFLPGDSDLIWGPQGSQFVVVRSIALIFEKYVALDLRTGRWLCEETWVNGKRREGLK
jgi:hypothetical protein